MMNNKLLLYEDTGKVQGVYLACEHHSQGSEDYVCEPERDDCSILEMDDEPPRSIPDSSIKEFLSARYGIDNMMELQNLEKNKRNLIIREVCGQGAGFRQLARITGISYGIIQRVVTDRRTVP